MSKQIYSKVDKYTKLAQRQSYPARSIYKLQQINEKYKLFNKHSRVLDLGCAPGSWFKYCIEQCTHGHVIGIDRTHIDINKLITQQNIQCKVEFIHSDIYKWDVPTQYSNQYFDVILSDMAPNTTGNKQHDHTGSVELVLKTMTLAQQLLKQNGSLLIKYFQGEYDTVLMSKLRDLYTDVRTIKPDASRKNSVEMFVLARNRRQSNNTIDTTTL